MTLEQQLEKIAQDVLGIYTLKTQNSDLQDFHTVSVWSLKLALEKAYVLGIKDTQNIH